MYNNRNYIKLLLTFFSYFFITVYGVMIFTTLGIKSEILKMFLNDIVFLIFIIWMYYSNIKEDFNEIKKNYKIKQILKNVFLGVIIILFLKMFFAIVFDFALQVDDASDPNTLAIYSLASRSSIYIIFKTMIFTVIAEQLLFRESLRECIDNKWIFVFVSAVIVTIMNFVFSNYSLGISIPIVYFALVGYFIPALLFSVAYVQNKSNIIVLMLTYFVYNLIPLANLLLTK